ncbi:aminoglycoside phosphotransferase family protein [Streptomyces sp. NPDC014603]|jgi:streptomycin 6-kinase|uniref:Hydroxyurea phosphotransferase n=2 Tax=unclassified Streptomyces TaxID=2593676 RepID=A0A6G3QW86_9ACTN|nr:MULTISPECIES: aminoglycoside phosphotransferase family protein [unclassified Streptomyces]MBM7092607.1 hydroxyurea phosphotransferase [Streptomyces sp. S12]NEA87450.1 hydroxyurea phosphotransferase [Streptomyces sp. SID14436]NEC83938.1 hydroxyurea phosphotransferase [Streptomyces sp. SID7958]
MIDVPPGLAAAQIRFNKEAGRAFVTALPRLTASFVERWELRVTGRPLHGVSALVVPVDRADGTPAMLKLQIRDHESEGEPVALRAWDGDGAVRLLDHDEPTGTMLLERLDSSRMLSRVASPRDGVLVIARLLARLHATPAPAGLRRLGDIARRMLERTPPVLERIADPEARRVVADCAAAVREVAGEPGDRLLHWDLHDENVLAADRAPWLAIDPKPLAGDPGFDLWPALGNNFDADDVAWRFDAMTDVLGLDRERARAWTYGRVLQNCLWETEEGRPLGAEDLEIARRLRGR